jgi:hypothetical protein
LYRRELKKIMGSTYITFKNPALDQNLGGGFWMRDGLLEVWLRLLSLHVEVPVINGAVIRESLATSIRDQWLLASGGHFIGCIPHGLEEAASTPEGKAIIRTAVLSLLEALSKTGDWIAKDTLNLMGIEGEFEADLKISDFIGIGRTFLDLLDGKFDQKNTMIHILY